MTENRRTLMGALVGLARSLDGSNSTPDMLAVMLAALGASEEDLPAQIQEVREAKHRAVPDCSTCQNPCGRTFDYDLDEMDKLEPSIAEAKYRLIRRIEGYAAVVGEDDDYAPALARLKEALFAVGYDWFTVEQLDEKLAGY